MAKEIDSSSFETNTVSASARPVTDTLQAQVHTQCNAQQASASSKEGYSIDEVAQNLGVARRTAFKYASEVLEVWDWLDEADFRKTGTYTEFALTELKNRKSFARLDDYRQAVHEANADRIQAVQQPIEAELVDESPAGMIHVPEVEGLSRLDLARKKQAEVHNRLTQTLEEFKDWDEALNAQITANKEATKIEGEAEFDEKVIDLLLKKKAEQDRLKKLEELIDSGAISADDLLKKYAGTQPGNSPAAVS